MRLARIAARCTTLTLFLVATSSAAQSQTEIELWADRDDDDRNGIIDAEETTLAPVVRTHLTRLNPAIAKGKLSLEGDPTCARLVVEDKPFPWNRVPGGVVYLQGIHACNATLVSKHARKEKRIPLHVNEASIVTATGRRESFGTSRVTIARLPPTPVAEVARAVDNEEVRVLLQGASELPSEVTLESITWFGQRVDVLRRVPLQPVACSRMLCKETFPLRLSIDDVDRSHSFVEGRALKAELGGAIVVRLGDGVRQIVRVLGPRATPAGPVERLRAHVRPIVVRAQRGGVPAIGATDAGAVVAFRAEMAAAAAIWAQCGVSFGDPRTLDVKVVDPPQPHMIAVGDASGAHASGGHFVALIDQRRIDVPISFGSLPSDVAHRIGMTIEKEGFVVTLSPNARMAAAANASVDVLVQRKDGQAAIVETTHDAPLCSDPTMGIQIGAVDLLDGLDHFSDVDAMTGTLEERALLKALDDGDPRTIEVVVVPQFAGGGRIGESFIASDRSSLRGMVLVDRGGVRSRRSSHTLAHELGHVLLDMPGHPDDYGLDTPSQLMDSDASDASAFGPRRLSLDECARMIRQSGPKAPVPLLEPWPVGPVPVDEPLPTIVH